MAGVMSRLVVVDRDRLGSSRGKMEGMVCSSAKMGCKGFSRDKRLVILNLDHRQIRGTGTIMVAGGMRNKVFKVQILVEVLVSLIKDLLMKTGIRTIEVIFRIVDHIGSSSIIIGHIAEIIIVVLVMGDLETL
jgi:hypothetical protein